MNRDGMVWHTLWGRRSHWHIGRYDDNDDGDDDYGDDYGDDCSKWMSWLTSLS